MDKELITDADINTLINASNKLNKGETVVATLKTGILGSKVGESKVVKTIVRENLNEGRKIINIPGTVPVIGEGIKGEAIIDAFKVAKTKQESFSLKRSFFNAVEKIVSSANSIKMNFFRVIYNSDEFGRVYIECEDKRHYLNKEKTHFITEDGNFGRIDFNKDGTVDLKYIDCEKAVYESDFINFSYLYISPEAARRGEELIIQEEERMMEEFMGENPLSAETPFLEDFRDGQELIRDTSSKVIDLEAYRRSIEKGPKR